MHLFDSFTRPGMFSSILNRLISCRSCLSHVIERLTFQKVRTSRGEGFGVGVSMVTIYYIVT